MVFVGVEEEFLAIAQKCLSREQFRQLPALYRRVERNPLQGRLLHPRGLREFRLDGKRVYFVTDGVNTLFVDASDKKSQQEVVDELRASLDELFALLKSVS